MSFSPPLIQVAGAYRSAGEVADAAQADAARDKAESLNVSAVIEIVVVMAVETPADAKAPGEFVDGDIAVGMGAGRFMADQDIGALLGEPVVVGRENRAVVLARDALAPEPGLLAASEQIFGRGVLRFRRRPPDLRAEDPAQAGDAGAGDFLDPAVQIAMGQGRTEQMVVILVAVGVVVAVDKPDVGQVENRFQRLLQGLGGLDVAQQDDGDGAMLSDGGEEMIETAVGVAAEEDWHN